MTNMGWFNFHPVCLFRARAGIAHSRSGRAEALALAFLRDREGLVPIAAIAGFGVCSDGATAGVRTRGHSTGHGPARGGHGRVPFCWTNLVPQTVMARLVQATHFFSFTKKLSRPQKRAMTKSGGLREKHVRNQQVTTVVPQAKRSGAIREMVRRYKPSVTLSSDPVK